MSSQDSSEVTWERLVRYLPEGDTTNIARYGDPVVESGEDIGLLASRGSLKVKVLQGSNPFDAKATGDVETVGKLLGPLTVDDVPIIRCVGLNYRTHSKPSRTNMVQETTQPTDLQLPSP